MKPKTLLIIALAIALFVFVILWYQGRQSTKRTAFDIAAKAVEDSAAVWRPILEAEKARADTAEKRWREAEVEVGLAMDRADSISASRQRVIREIVERPVPEDARQYTDPLHAVIESQDDEISELRSAVASANTALAHADTALSAERNARVLAERTADAALEALAMRPTERWYIPTIGLGYSATVSRRELVKNGRVEIHDGPSISAVWKIRF